MNTERKPTINKNLDQSFTQGFAYSPSAADLDFSFFEEDELSEEQLALKRLYHATNLNRQYQQKLQFLLKGIQAKIEKNNQKLEKVNEIITFKNKRNKIQLKKKQIEFYKYEEPKLPPESFRIFERIRQSKGQKNFYNLYKSLIEDSSSEGEEQEEKLAWGNYEEEKEFLEDTQETQSNINQIKIKKESEDKPLNKATINEKKSKSKGIKKEEKKVKQEGEKSNKKKKKNEAKRKEDEEENDMDYEDDFDMEMDSEDEMQSVKRRGDSLGIDSFIVQYKDKNAREIDWLALARKVNSRTISKENTPIVTPLDLYRRFINDEIQRKRNVWTQEDDRALLNAVKLHGTTNWKQIANNIEGKNTYLCFQRWAKSVNPDISKGRWKLEEDIKLSLAVECFKAGNWIAVASLFRNRTDVQCRERWCNILNPELNGKEWSKEEDQMLILGVMKHGKRWAQVSRMLKNRTDNQCWRRWKIISRKPRNGKSLVEQMNWNGVGLDEIKVNYKKPFKLERKKIKKIPEKEGTNNASDSIQVSSEKMGHQNNLKMEFESVKLVPIKTPDNDVTTLKSTSKNDENLLEK